MLQRKSSCDQGKVGVIFVTIDQCNGIIHCQLFETVLHRIAQSCTAEVESTPRIIFHILLLWERKPAPSGARHDNHGRFTFTKAWQRVDTHRGRTFRQRSAKCQEHSAVDSWIAIRHLFAMLVRATMLRLVNANIWQPRRILAGTRSSTPHGFWISFFFYCVRVQKTRCHSLWWSSSALTGFHIYLRVSYLGVDWADSKLCASSRFCSRIPHPSMDRCWKHCYSGKEISASIALLHTGINVVTLALGSKVLSGYFGSSGRCRNLHARQTCAGRQHCTLHCKSYQLYLSSSNVSV